MSRQLVLLIHLLLCCLDVMMFYSFFASMFTRRFSKKRCILHISAMVITVVCVNALGNTGVNLLVLPVLYILFSIITFCISISNGVGYTLIFYIVFAASREAAFEMLYRMMEKIFPEIMENILQTGILLLLIPEYILTILFLIYIEHFTKKLEIEEKGRFCWYMLIMPCVSLVVLITFSYMDFPDSRMLQVLMCGGAFLLFISNTVIFIILQYFTESMNRIKLIQLSALKKDMEKNNYDRVEKVNAVYQKYIHDFHQYLRQFRSLALAGETAAIVGIVNEVEGTLDREENVLYSTSPVLNSILYENSHNAQEQGIEVSIFVEDGIRVEFISDGDKISMFGNLLANAVEAAAKCRDGGRKLKIRLFMGSKYFLVFQIENTFTGEIRRQNGQLLSTKEDEYCHGLGIGIVKELASKYGGTLEVAEQAGLFLTTLMISSYVEAGKRSDNVNFGVFTV